MGRRKGDKTPPKYHAPELQAQIEATFTYDPLTGAITRIKRPGGKGGGACKLGVVTLTDANGYMFVDIERVRIYQHILAWRLMTGEWPTSTVDHEDLDKSNNRWSNLREATQSQQNCNTPVRKDSMTGIKGVGLHKKTGKYRARVTVNGKTKNLGLFATVDAAAAARKAAAAKAHGEFLRS